MGRGLRIGFAPGYTTNFDTTENPIVEDGNWAFAASYWQKPRTANGLCFASATSSDYDDCVALRNGINTVAQRVIATLRRRAAYTPANTHEAQIILFGGFGAGPTVTGYELLFSAGGTFQCMRWRGSPGSGYFTGLTGTNHNGGPTGWGNNTVFDARAVIVSGNPYIELYQDDVLVFDVTDSDVNKVTSGKPGLAMFARPEVAGDEDAYCWTRAVFSSLA